MADPSAHKRLSVEERAISMLEDLTGVWRSQLLATQNELESTASTLATKKAELQRLNEDLSAKKAYVAMLQTQKREAEEALRRAKAEESEAKAADKLARAEADSAKVEAVAARAEAAEAKAEAKTAWAEYASAKATTEAARAEAAAVQAELRTAQAEVATTKAALDSLTTEIKNANMLLAQHRAEMAILDKERQVLLAGLKDRRMWRQFGMSQWMLAEEPIPGRVPKVLLVTLETAQARPDYFPHLSGFTRDDLIARGLWLVLTNMGAIPDPITLAIRACDVEERNRTRRIPAATQTQFVRVKGGRGRPSTNEQIVGAALKEIDDTWRLMKSQRSPLPRTESAELDVNTTDDPDAN